MRKLLLLSITASMMIGTLSMMNATARPWRQRECRYQLLDGRRGWSVGEVKRTIECVTHRYGISTATMMYVANRESHFFARALNPSSACGVMQHMGRFWGSRIASAARAWPKMRPFAPSCYDARSNIFAAAFMVKHGGWSPWAL